jgi:Sap, sulfolipid-1-addressing protein
VADGWGSVLAELVPLALVIALSPLSVIPAVLVLHTPRPRPAGVGLLAGWMCGLAALTIAFVGLSDLFGGGLDRPPVGIVAAHRARSGADRGRGLALAHSPPLGAFAGLAADDQHHHPGTGRRCRGGAGGHQSQGALRLPRIRFGARHRGPGNRGAWAALVVFVVVGASSVAVPVVGYAVAGDRIDEPLTRLKDWLERHNAALVAVILVAIGVLVLYKGIHGLA